MSLLKMGAAASARRKKQSGGGAFGGHPTLANGLLHWWQFGEGTGSTAADSHGSLDLTLQGGTSFSSTARIGNYSVLFDGATGKASSTSTATYTNFTVAFWARHSSTTGPQCYIGRWNTTLNQRIWSVYYQESSSAIDFNLMSGAFSNPDIFRTNYVPSVDTWFHFIGTWDGDRQRSYINGAWRATSSSRSYTMPIFGVPLILGMFDNDIFLMNGRMDGVGIWARVLDFDERSLLATGIGY